MKWKVERMVGSRAKFAMIGAVALALTALPGFPQGASAATEEIVPESRIAAVMAEVPGAVLINENHAVWPELGMEMEAPADGVVPFAVGLCPTGYICVFDSYGAQGAKIMWNYCGNPSVAASFTVRSIANARGIGFAQARAGTTVRGTASAGGYANVYLPVDNVRCVEAVL